LSISKLWFRTSLAVSKLKAVGQDEVVVQDNQAVVQDKLDSLQAKGCRSGCT
jgi:hypothetical protein